MPFHPYTGWFDTYFLGVLEVAFLVAFRGVPLVAYQVAYQKAFREVPLVACQVAYQVVLSVVGLMLVLEFLELLLEDFPFVVLAVDHEVAYLK